MSETTEKAKAVLNKWRAARQQNLRLLEPRPCIADLYDALAASYVHLSVLEDELTEVYVAHYAERDGGRAVHRLWRDTMHDQGRDTLYRDVWEMLAVSDQALDRTIAKGLLLDFLGSVSARVTARVNEQKRRVFYNLYTDCRAGDDGDCDWPECPQTRDGEPARSGRHCPLDLPRGDGA